MFILAVPFDYYAMGSRIRELRIRAGLTQEQLSEAADISTSFVGFIERGEKRCSVETVYNLAVSLGASMDYLVFGNKNLCNQQSCALYMDLRNLVNAYGDEQLYSPRLHRAD